MSNTQRRVAVIGAGAIGGSIARALLGRPEVSLSISDSDSLTRTRAAAAGLRVTRAEDAVCGADLVVFAVPSDQLSQTVVDLRRAFRPGAVLTDVAAVKRESAVTAAALRAARHDVHFVLGHPIVAATGSGFNASAPDAFRGRPWFLGQPGDDLGVRAEVAHFVTALGATPIVGPMDEHDHDTIVGMVEHAPRVLAAALAAELVASPDVTAVPTLFDNALRWADASDAQWDEAIRLNRPDLQRALARTAIAVETLLFALGSTDETADYAHQCDALHAAVHGGMRLDEVHLTGDDGNDAAIRAAEMMAAAITLATESMTHDEFAAAPDLLTLVGPVFADTTALARQGLAALSAAAGARDRTSMDAYRTALHLVGRAVARGQQLTLRTASNTMVVFGGFGSHVDGVRPGVTVGHEWLSAARDLRTRTIAPDLDR